MILITTYNRPNALLSLLKELEGEEVAVFDDHSRYDPEHHTKYCQYYYKVYPHCGKKRFWDIWRGMFDVARNSDADEFIFLQDDLYDIDLQGLRAVETPEYYALNLMNRGNDRGWSPNGYVDCCFKANRKTLDKIGWRIPAVNPKRWERNPNLSSGVGQKLSQLFYRNDIPMLLPDRNYASHGKYESQMNPNERKINPLKCKTGE